MTLLQRIRLTLALWWHQLRSAFARSRATYNYEISPAGRDGYILIFWEGEVSSRLVMTGSELERISRYIHDEHAAGSDLVVNAMMNGVTAHSLSVSADNVPALARAIDDHLVRRYMLVSTGVSLPA